MQQSQARKEQLRRGLRRVIGGVLLPLYLARVAFSQLRIIVLPSLRFFFGGYLEIGTWLIAFGADLFLCDMLAHVWLVP